MHASFLAIHRLVNKLCKISKVTKIFVNTNVDKLYIRNAITHSHGESRHLFPRACVMFMTSACVFAGFLSEECDDTLLELSKLSIADADHNITIIEKQDTSERIVTARDYVLRRCNQTDAILFDECYPDVWVWNTISKYLPFIAHLCLGCY